MSKTPPVRRNLVAKHAFQHGGPHRDRKAELTPDEGTVKLGANLEPVYLDQSREGLRSDMTLWDALTPGGGDSVLVRGVSKHVAAYAKDFLFRDSQLCMSLLLPFALQWSLGGFVDSSAVCLWALVAPLGALAVAVAPVVAVAPLGVPGDELGDPVLEPLTITVAERQVVRIRADPELARRNLLTFGAAGEQREQQQAQRWRSATWLPWLKRSPGSTRPSARARSPGPAPRRCGSCAGFGRRFCG